MAGTLAHPADTPRSWPLGGDHEHRDSRQERPARQVLQPLPGLLPSQVPGGDGPFGIALQPEHPIGGPNLAEAATADCATGARLTLAVGYGGRREPVDAVRNLLHAHARADTGRPVRALHTYATRKRRYGA
ncbi:hypothetical protein [Kitasatospora cineracea]|uniref:hypothetical protein n=1 Tax=Kitasatospora cineracea TaxID=88074 RepID=UPI003813A8C1